MQYLLNNDGRSVKTVMDNTRKTYIRKYVDIIELDHNLWVINELGKTHIFLINGARRALLIDTGLGIADLPEIVRRLCGRKPVIVVNTHSHGDHNSGNWMFDTVFVDRFDEPYALRVMGTRERELSRHAYFSDAIKAGFNFEGWRPRPAERIRSIREGCSIDIGNYCLDVIEIPSHTAGSIALYEKTKGWLFPGDVLLEWETWGHLTSGVLAPSVSLMEYLRSLQKLKELWNCDKVVSFGDAINDIPMFEISDECYAVENAVDELKAHATGIIESNDNDGVAKWLLEHAVIDLK